MKKMLIIGATSAIASATARLFANDGSEMFLIARDSEKLAAVADDLRSRGAGSVDVHEMDVLDYDRHQSAIEDAIAKLGGLDVALIAHGSLPDQPACEASFELTRQELEVSALSVVSLLTHLANYFEKEKRGSIAVISSVAGERGRKSNYVYGAAKGMVSVYMQGLRNRLYSSNVTVTTIKPGFVSTPMTAAFKKGIVWISPERAALDVHRAIQKGKDVVYVPWYWAWIMLVIRHIPEWLFKRLGL